MLIDIILERNDKMKIKLFSKSITPKCAYCQYGNKSKEGNKILCEKQGLVMIDFSCSKFLYSPYKRIPVKQLNITNEEDDSI